MRVDEQVQEGHHQANRIMEKVEDILRDELSQEAVGQGTFLEELIERLKTLEAKPQFLRR